MHPCCAWVCPMYPHPGLSEILRSPEILAASQSTQGYRYINLTLDSISKQQHPEVLLFQSCMLLHVLPLVLSLTQACADEG
ncbi:unnamed protein product [Arctogadus glacialis]